MRDIMAQVDREVAVASNAVFDTYEQAIQPFSCVWCVAEGAVFLPVAEWVHQHPESMIFILHRSLQGRRLSIAFRILFKEQYLQTYQQLLQDAGISLIPEDEIENEDQRQQNLDKELSLSLASLTEAYLTLIK